MPGISEAWLAVCNTEIFIEKLLKNPLTLSRYRYIIKTQKRKGEHKDDWNEIF